MNDTRAEVIRMADGGKRCIEAARAALQQTKGDA